MRWKLAIAIVLILSAMASVTFISLQSDNQDSPTQKDISSDQTNQECENKIFEFPPVNLDKTSVLVPFGLMTGNHVTPIDHQYFQNFQNEEANIEVYSPGKGTIRDIQHMIGSYFDKGEEVEWADYRIVIEHECDISSIYIHIDKLSDKLSLVAPAKGEYTSVNVEVEAGEIIGWYSKNVDYNLVDQNFILKGFVIPEHYESEDWKIHVPDTLDYFNENIKEKMASISLRAEDPIGGKFDYDIDRKLIGNWFLQGTNGYAGLSREDYWIGHLSISPNYLDSSHFIFSIGDYEGEPAQFGIQENSPSPSEVSTDSGIIKYELTYYDYYYNKERWDRTSLKQGLKAKNEDQVLGIVLLEMQEDRILKLEIFPGKLAEEVSGFSVNAKTYER